VIRFSHSKATISGGAIMQTRSGLGAIRRKQVSHSSHSMPLQRAVSFGRLMACNVV
jgi:hypothetical protein